MISLADASRQTFIGLSRRKSQQGGAFAEIPDGQRGAQVGDVDARGGKSKQRGRRG